MSEKINIEDYVFCISCNIFYFKNLKMCPLCRMKIKMQSIRDSDRNRHGDGCRDFCTEVHDDID